MCAGGMKSELTKCLAFMGVRNPNQEPIAMYVVEMDGNACIRCCDVKNSFEENQVCLGRLRCSENADRNDGYTG